MLQDSKLSFKEKLQLREKSSLLTRIILFLTITITSVVVACFIPQVLISKEYIYDTALNHALIETDDDLVFKNNVVYTSADNFNNKIQGVINERLANFKNKHSLLVVKFNGTGEQIRYDDYILMFDPDVAINSADFYAVKSIKFSGNIIPTETAISIGYSFSAKFNEVVYPLILTLIGAGDVVLLTFIGIYSSELIKRKKLIKDK